MRENTDQKNLRISTLFTQCLMKEVQNYKEVSVFTDFSVHKPNLMLTNNFLFSFFFLALKIGKGNIGKEAFEIRKVT